MSHRASELAALCELAGMILEYEDFRGERRRASVDSQLAILRALGVGIEREDEAGAVLEELRATRWQETVAPCAVAERGTASIELRLPDAAVGDFAIEVALESGERLDLRGRTEDAPVVDAAAAGGRNWVARTVQISGLPVGYHRAEVSAATRRGSCLIISAPDKAFGAPGDSPPGWGVFAPVYGLRSEATLGIGSLGDLRALSAWTRRMGGNLVGTLPLLAAFYDRPFEPSPYSPASRLFWNELFIDLADLASRFDCPAGRALVSAADVRAEAAAIAREPLVDYRRQAKLVHRILAAFADWADTQPLLRERLAAFCAEDPLVADYARFRAAVDADGPWPDWEPAARAGNLAAAARNPASERYHLFAQLVLRDQLGAFKHDESLAGLYLDLPVGTNALSFDVYRDRESFALAASAGAPPDELFLGGQNWCLPPVNPRAARRNGFRYFIACARAQMAHASMLRVDHVMGLHRLYWVPEGAPATEGVYVRYPAEELYAILCLESHREKCAIVGEDLGTVPEYVRPEMSRRGMHRLYVAQFGLPGGEGQAPDKPPAGAVASLGTHDTPTFAGFWEGLDIDQRQALGLITEAQAAEEHAGRARTRAATIAYLERAGRLAGGERTPAAVMKALTEELAASPARQVLVTLEDLWLEPVPQNVPGTGYELPNWRRKLARSLEEIQVDTGVSAVLEATMRERRKIVDQDP